MKRWLLSLLLIVRTGALFGQSATIVPEANPGRPTVSTPATLTPVGYLQFETGVFGGTDSPDFSSRVNVSEVVKLAVHPRLQLLLASEPLAHTESDVKQTVFGDAFVGFQAVAIGREGAPATLSFGYSHKVREAGIPEIDFGSPRNSAIVLLSTDAFGFHFDANALANELVEEPIRRAQFGQTLSISHPVKKLIVSGEIWHFTQPFLHGHAVGNLWGFAYPVRKNLVVAVGFNRGLTSTSTRWEAFAGFTYVLPHRLW
jgi:hypothetical protein